MANDQPTGDDSRVQAERARKAEYMRQYRAKNRERYKKIDKEHERRQREKDPVVFLVNAKERQRRYRERKKAKGETAEEREKRIRAGREANQRYRDAHKGDDGYKARRRANYRRNYAANREKYLGYIRRWQETPEGQACLLANNRKRHARKKGVGGTITKEQWAAILESFGRRCFWCDKELTDSYDTTMDHVKPLSKGGPHTPDNVVPACRSCNSSKHAKSAEEFLAMRTADKAVH